MNVTRQYKDLQEEATENRKVIEVLKQKYQEVKTEMRDLKDEH